MSDDDVVAALWSFGLVALALAFVFTPDFVFWCVLFLVSMYIGFTKRYRAQRRYAEWCESYALARSDAEYFKKLAHSEEARRIAEGMCEVTAAFVRDDAPRDGEAG